MTQRLTTNVSKCPRSKASKSRDPRDFDPQAQLQASETPTLRARSSNPFRKSNAGGFRELRLDIRSRAAKVFTWRDMLHGRCRSAFKCVAAYRLLSIARIVCGECTAPMMSGATRCSARVLVRFGPHWNASMQLSLDTRFFRIAKLPTALVAALLLNGIAKSAETPPFRNTDETEDGQWLTP